MFKNNGGSGIHFPTQSHNETSFPSHALRLWSPWGGSGCVQGQGKVFFPKIDTETRHVYKGEDQ